MNARGAARWVRKQIEGYPRAAVFAGVSSALGISAILGGRVRIIRDRKIGPAKVSTAEDLTAAAERGQDLSTRIVKRRRREPRAGVFSPRQGSANETARDGRFQMRELRELGQKGKAIYEKMRNDLEATAHGQCICINIDTGGYVLGDTPFSAYDKFKDKFGDAPSYEARVGEDPYVFDGGALQRHRTAAN
jgi:hypothetical protein